MNVVGVDNIAPEIAPEVLGMLREADDILDDACTLHNDFAAGEYLG